MSAQLLYSFRRCPYAMRARLALYLSGLNIELREIVLRDKPASMLEYSPKGTVPVLVIETVQGDTQVIDESLDIMRWALEQKDIENLLAPSTALHAETLIAENDGEFKHYLDRYKYADRYPEHTEEYYRAKAERFIEILEKQLEQHTYLCGTEACLADIAIFPFIRQFAHVDLAWFESANYPHVQAWLAHYKESEAFLAIMKKYPAWREGDACTYLPVKESL